MTLGQLNGRTVAIQDGLACVMLLGRLRPHGDGWCVMESGRATRWELDDGSELIVKVTEQAEEVRCVLTQDEHGWYLLDARTLFTRDQLDGLIVRAVYTAVEQ